MFEDKNKYLIILFIGLVFIIISFFIKFLQLGSVKRNNSKYMLFTTANDINKKSSSYYMYVKYPEKILQDNDTVYFIVSNNNKMYIASANAKVYAKLINIDLDKNKTKIVGDLLNPTDYLKKDILASYNKNKISEEIIDFENYDNYFGKYILNITDDNKIIKDNSINLKYYILFLIFIFIGGGLTFWGYYYINRDDNYFINDNY